MKSSQSASSRKEDRDKRINGRKEEQREVRGSVKRLGIDYTGRQQSFRLNMKERMKKKRWNFSFNLLHSCLSYIALSECPPKVSISVELFFVFYHIFKSLKVHVFTLIVIL